MNNMLTQCGNKEEQASQLPTSLARTKSKRKSRSLILLLGLLVAASLLVPTVSSAVATTPPKAAPTKPAKTISSTGSTSPTATLAPTSTDSIIPSNTVPQPIPSTEVGGGGGSDSNAALMAALACPPPLIHNILNLTSQTCIGPCCIPCPASSVFYEAHKLENIYTATSIIRAVSAVACALLSIVYLILPSRRKHPHVIVVCFALVMIPWDGAGTAWLRWKNDLLCKNVYEIATMSNSWFCGVQGIAMIYFALVILCLAVLLIANLHMLTVFRSPVIQSHMTKLIILAFILPLSSVLPIAIRKQIENPGFGSVCFVSPKVADPYFFYPLSILACIGASMHLGTIGFMIKASINANSASVGDSTLYSDSQSNNAMSNRRRRLQTAREITRILKQQWRAGLLAICLIAVDMTYWLFYFIEAKKLETVNPSTDWFTDWVVCLAEQAIASVHSGLLSATSTPADFKTAGEIAQSSCASIAHPFVPSLAWAAVTDVFPAIIGVITLIIFGSKVELWKELRKQLCGGSKRKDKTVFIMNDIQKDGRPHQLKRHQSQKESQQQQKAQNQAENHNDKDGFYSGELSLSPSAYNSCDVLTNSQGRSNANDGDLQVSHPCGTDNALPSSLTKVVSFSTSATYGGPTKKSSIKIVEDREPILYRNPNENQLSQQEQQQQARKRTMEEDQQRAQLVTEGSEPWPSWPTTTSTSTLYPLSSPTSPTPLASPFSMSNSPTGRRPNLTVRTRDSSVSTQSTASSIPILLSPASPHVKSPASPGFYNSEDLIAGPISILKSQRAVNNTAVIPARISSRTTSPSLSQHPLQSQRPPQQQQQQQQRYNQRLMDGNGNVTLVSPTGTYSPTSTYSQTINEYSSPISAHSPPTSAYSPINEYSSPTSAHSPPPLPQKSGRRRG